jgi:16S rRNA (guanine966-N2)-methyltransferase
LSRASNLVRIIGGEHRGRRLNFIPAAGLRPTPDRVRETLFNWLRDDVRGARCLDLFAGSGALAFEALSRGAESVTAVDRHRAVVQKLRDNAAMLNLGSRMTILQGDAMQLLEREPLGQFDVVFVDPPFADRQVAAVIDALCRPGWLTDAAVLYLEQAKAQPWPAVPPGWLVHREGDAGQSAQRLLRRST